MSRNTLCAVPFCRNPAAFAIDAESTKCESRIPLLDLCEAHAVAVHAAVAAERTCATCRHRRGIGGECFHPGGPMPIWAVRRPDFGCNGWGKRGETTR